MFTVQALARLAVSACVVLGALASADSHAARVGHFGNSYGSNPAASITAAGHTPVAVAALTPEALSGLAALYVNANGRFQTNAAVDAAVSAGMTLVVHDQNYGATLPGSTAVVANGGTSADIDFAPGVPILSGPGGTLDNATLDNGSSSNHGHVSRANLPAGSQVFATTATLDHVITYQYPYGAGRVLYSTIPLGCYLQQGSCAGESYLSLVSQGMQRYAANVIAWAAGPSFTTCAAEGYTGTKLTLCQKVCESNLTGTTLTAMIRLYVTAYREQPACVR